MLPRELSMATKDQSNLDTESVASQWHLLRCCVRENFYHLRFSDLYIRYNQTGPVLLERWRNRFVQCPDFRSFQLPSRRLQFSSLCLRLGDFWTFSLLL